MRCFALIAVLALAFLLCGCAKFPSNQVQPSGKQLVITMTVAGRLNPSYFYFVAFNTNGDTTQGPVPVVGPPWGNGWGTGNITFFVRYTQGVYRIFRIVPGTNNLGIVDTGAQPIGFVDPGPSGKTLRFTIDVSQIATTELPADQLESLTVNFISTDIQPEDPNFPGPKYYDGLGETGNDFLTISLAGNRLYSNSEFNIEPSGDVLNGDPDLDITDWSIEVQTFGA